MSASEGFQFRMAESWLKQPGRRPFPNLFSSEMDEQLLQDYRESLPRLAESGFNYLTLYGLLGESGPNQLPLDMSRGFSARRDRIIHRLIRLMHQAGLKYVSGLGVYSWGFAEIIRAHPELGARTFSDLAPVRAAGWGSAGWDEELLPHLAHAPLSPAPARDVLCASCEESWTWQQKAVDFLLERYPEIDGFHLESADLGRCWCENCRKLSTPEYHTRINERTAAYLRQAAPEKIIFITDCGVQWPTLRALPYLKRLARYADCLIDMTDSFRLPVKFSLWGRQEILDLRAQVTAALPCAYAITVTMRDAGLPRDRWFLPLPKSLYNCVRTSYEQGCRGLQFYPAGPFYNPGFEFVLELIGAVLLRPQASYQEVVDPILARLYAPQDSTTLAGLRAIFEDAELLVAESRLEVNLTHHAVPEIERGIPVFAKRLGLSQLAYYQRGLEGLACRAEALEAQLGNKRRAQALTLCARGSAASMAEALSLRLAGGLDDLPGDTH